MPKKDERRGSKLDPSWTQEEDAALDHAVQQVGESWGLVADMVNLNPHVLTRRRWTADECKDHYYMKEDGARAPAACKPWFYIEAIIEAVTKKRDAKQETMIIDEAGAAQPPRVPYPAPTAQQAGQFNMAGVQPGMPPGSAPATAGRPGSSRAPP